MSAVRTVSAADMATRCTELLNEVQERGISIDIERGNAVVARITPVADDSGLSLDRLDEILLTLPLLTNQEAESFSNDMHAGLAGLATNEEVWDL